MQAQAVKVSPVGASGLCPPVGPANEWREGQIYGWRYRRMDGYLGLLRVEEGKARLTKGIRGLAMVTFPHDGVEGVPGTVLERYRSHSQWIWG